MQSLELWKPLYLCLVRSEEWLWTVCADVSLWDVGAAAITGGAPPHFTISLPSGSVTSTSSLL